MRRKWHYFASISSTGARRQFALAIALISVVPFLALAYLSNVGRASELSNNDRLSVGIIAVVLVFLGYLILLKYPITIIRLRRCLNKVAGGELPDKVTLLRHETDIGSIENDLNIVLAELKEQIEAIRREKELVEKQRAQLTEAERQRVMIESLGAACHHLGQPATVIKTYLGIMKTKETDQAILDMIEDCIKAVNSMGEILQKLKHVSKYRTEPYLPVSGGTPSSDDRILSI